MTYPRSKHVALVDTQTLLSKYSFVSTHENFVYYTILTQRVSHRNTLRLGYKTSQLMLYREIIAVCSQIHTEHMNTLCGQNAELLNVKLGVYIVIGVDSASTEMSTRSISWG